MPSTSTCKCVCMCLRVCRHDFLLLLLLIPLSLLSPPSPLLPFSPSLLLPPPFSPSPPSYRCVCMCRALSEFKSELEREDMAASMADVPVGPMKDMSLKEGERIKIKIVSSVCRVSCVLCHVSCVMFLHAHAHALD
jgi:hypothetical protein